MKLIIQNDRIAATATDDYEGPDPFIMAPADFDLARLGDYRLVDGQVVIQPPHSVTRAQARKALVLAGLFAEVQPAINAIQDPVQRQLVQIDWDDRVAFERDNPTLLQLAGALGLTAEQLDALFIQAGAL